VYLAIAKERRCRMAARAACAVKSWARSLEQRFTALRRRPRSQCHSAALVQVRVGQEVQVLHVPNQCCRIGTRQRRAAKLAGDHPVGELRERLRSTVVSIWRRETNSPQGRDADEVGVVILGPPTKVRRREIDVARSIGQAAPCQRGRGARRKRQFATAPIDMFSCPARSDTRMNPSPPKFGSDEFTWMVRCRTSPFDPVFLSRDTAVFDPLPR